MDEQDLRSRYRAGLEITREAGVLALDYFRGRGKLTVERKGLQDFVSVADKKTEDLIVERMSAAFSDDSILGEEGGLRQRGPLLWVIDPIDGTANFLRGVGHWCVSLGLIADGKAMAGFLYNPVTDELFSAHAGGGAFLNGERIAVSAVTDIADSSLGTGFAHRLPLEPYVRDMAAMLKAGVDCRTFGSGALDFALVAAGRLDAAYYRHINLWDVAGGLAIVAEAGGRVSDFLAGKAVMTEGNAVLAATPALYEPLRAMLLDG
ncbi:MAG: inositol monophosphatase [Bauldia sp.]|nr:inositol monophosphatase [Bauldia sp.]